MILVREVFHCKYGRGDELVALLKELYGNDAQEGMSEIKSAHVLTDLSGRFFTVVTEVEVESIDAYQNFLQASFQRPEFPPMFAQMSELVDSGQREYYTIESHRHG